MSMKNICKLCDNEKKLCSSHIIPKSFTARMKKGCSQVVEMDVNLKKTIKSNGDFKEYLLCEECEYFLKVNYEDYGTIFLSSKKYIVETSNYIILNNFNYEKYNIFLLSILWRASVSSHNDYKNISILPCTIKNYLKLCIQEKKLNSTKIDEVIKISLLKVFDSVGEIRQDVIDGIMLNLSMYRENESDSIYYYMMLDGFFISFIFPNAQKNRVKILGRLVNRSYLKVPKICFRSIKEVFEAIISVTKANDPFAKGK